MAYIKIDTDKLKDCSSAIKKNIDEYQNNIETIFNNFANLDNAWIGDDAKEFIESISQIKKQYVELYNILIQYQQALSNIPNNIIQDLV